MFNPCKWRHVKFFFSCNDQQYIIFLAFRQFYTGDTQPMVIIFSFRTTLSSNSRDSSVGIALGYRLDDRGSRVRFPAGTGNFSLRHRVQNGSRAHPTSYPMGKRGCFHRGKAAGRGADHSPPCSAEVKECVELYSYPQYALMEWFSVKSQGQLYLLLYRSGQSTATSRGEKNSQVLNSAIETETNLSMQFSPPPPPPAKLYALYFLLVLMGSFY
jgi:hypothetical protein